MYKRQGQINRLTYARRYDAQTMAMYGVSIQEFENDTLVRVQNAEKADWSNDHWTMHNGILYDLSAEGNVQQMCIRDSSKDWCRTTSCTFSRTVCNRRTRTKFKDWSCNKRNYDSVRNSVYF